MGGGLVQLAVMSDPNILNPTFFNVTYKTYTQFSIESISLHLLTAMYEDFVSNHELYSNPLSTLIIFEITSNPIQSTEGCPICIDGLCNAQTSCNHIFCEFCIRRHIDKQHDCPMCRQSVTKVTICHPLFQQRVLPIFSLQTL